MTVGTVSNSVRIATGINPATSNEWEAKQLQHFVVSAAELIANYAPWEQTIKNWNVPGSCLPFKHRGEYRIPLPEDTRRVIAVRLNSDDGISRLMTDPKTWEAMTRNPPVHCYHHINRGELCMLPALDAGGAVVSYAGLSYLKSGYIGTEPADDEDFLFPDRLVELGAIWKWKQQKGLDYEAQKGEFDQALDLAVQHDRGGG